MGKNYEEYAKAVQEAGVAKNRWSDVQGGSTRDAYDQARTDLINKETAEQAAWDKLVEDPTG